WSTTPIRAGMSPGRASKSWVRATTPPAEAPMTMTSRAMPSGLSRANRFDRLEAFAPLLRLFEGMGRLDHRPNREALLPHFVHTSSHRFAVRSWHPVQGFFVGD